MKSGLDMIHKKKKTPTKPKVQSSPATTTPKKESVLSALKKSKHPFSLKVSSHSTLDPFLSNRFLINILINRISNSTPRR